MSNQDGRVPDSELPDLMDPAVQQCPYGLYKILRQRAPLYRMPSTGFHLVTNYELAREVIRAPDQYLSGVSPMALSDDGVPQEIIDIYENEGWLPLPPARRQIHRSTHESEVFWRNSLPRSGSALRNLPSTPLPNH